MPDPIGFHTTTAVRLKCNRSWFISSESSHFSLIDFRCASMGCCLPYTLPWSAHHACMHTEWPTFSLSLSLLPAHGLSDGPQKQMSSQTLAALWHKGNYAQETYKYPHTWTVLQTSQGHEAHVVSIIKETWAIACNVSNASLMVFLNGITLIELRGEI